MALAVAGSTQRKARILVVDDSASVRAMMISLLQEVTDDHHLAFAVDGRHALQQASRAALSASPFDLILLDIEMPLMDGLQALDELVKLRPAPKVVMSSALTRRGAAASMQALSRGASDYICKPSSADASRAEEFRHELLQKVRFWSDAPKSQSSPKPEPKPQAPAVVSPSPPILPKPPRSVQPKPIASSSPLISPARIKPSLSQSPAPICKPVIRQTPSTPFLQTSGVCRALAIGSSTGGPQALLHVLSHCAQVTRFPIFITQHMPPTFTTILAEQIAKASGMTCREAVHGEVVQAGQIYLAPGTNHMLVERQKHGASIVLSNAEPVNFCKPAVDPMLSALSEVYGSGLRVIILTGMGQDGLEGSRKAKANGAKIFAQDEVTSVVWGMPGAVSKAGVSDKTLPLQDFPNLINKL